MHVFTLFLHIHILQNISVLIFIKFAFTEIGNCIPFITYRLVLVRIRRLFLVFKFQQQSLLLFERAPETFHFSHGFNKLWETWKLNLFENHTKSLSSVDLEIICFEKHKPCFYSVFIAMCPCAKHT